MQEAVGQSLISVALCTYNGSRYLELQLDSLLGQTYKNIEIVAVDDCSTDETVAILKRYALRDPRLRVVVNGSNIGFRDNFANSLRLCRGEYIAPCDKDDIWLPEKLATLMAVIGDKPLAYCDSELIDSDGKSLKMRMSDMLAMSSTDDVLIFAFSNCVSGHAMLMRRELLLKAPSVPEFFFYDWWFAAVAASAGGIVYSGTCSVQYRQHGANVTNILASRSLDPKTRPRGYKSRDLRIIGSRLVSLAQLPGREQALIARLSHLWQLREAQWLSPSLGWTITRHRNRVFFIGKMRGIKLLRNALRFMPGLRLKRLFNPHAYDAA
jgi:glycosyltransferase involved in cell wall biosynthesis